MGSGAAEGQRHGKYISFVRHSVVAEACGDHLERAHVLSHRLLGLFGRVSVSRAYLTSSEQRSVPKHGSFPVTCSDDSSQDVGVKRRLDQEALYIPGESEALLTFVCGQE